jgi:hypothetical protein
VGSRAEGVCLEVTGVYGSTAVMLRFGTCPTGIRVTTFIDFASMTVTKFEPAQAT